MSKHQPTTKTNNKTKAHTDYIQCLTLDEEKMSRYKKEQLQVLGYLEFKNDYFSEHRETHNGWFFLTKVNISDATGVSRPTVDAIINRLAKDELIDYSTGWRKGEKNTASEFRLLYIKKEVDLEKHKNFTIKSKENFTIKPTDIEEVTRELYNKLYNKLYNDIYSELYNKFYNSIKNTEYRIKDSEYRIHSLEGLEEKVTSTDGIVDVDALFSSDSRKEEHQDQATQTNGMNEPSSFELELNDTPDGEKMNVPQAEAEKDNAPSENETTHTSSQRLSIEDYINGSTSNEDVMNFLYPSDDTYNEPQEPSEKGESNSKCTDLQGNIPSKPQNSPIQPMEPKTSVTTHTSTKEAQNNRKNTLTMEAPNQTITLEWIEAQTPNTKDERYAFNGKVFEFLKQPHTKEEHNRVLSAARKGYLNDESYEEFLRKNPYREQHTATSNEECKSLFAAAKEALKAIDTCDINDLKAAMVEAKRKVDAVEVIYTNKEKWQAYKKEKYSQIDAAFHKRTEKERYDKEEAINNQAYLRDIENGTNYSNVHRTIGNIFTPSKCKRISPQTIYDDCKQAVEKNTNLTDDEKNSLYNDLGVRLSLATEQNNNNQ